MEGSKLKTCFDCEYASIEGDASVGMDDHVEVCHAPMSESQHEALFEAAHPYPYPNGCRTFEAYVASQCGWFTPIIEQAKCPECGKEFKAEWRSWPWSALDEFGEPMLCCSQDHAYAATLEAWLRPDGLDYAAMFLPTTYLNLSQRYVKWIPHEWPTMLVCRRIRLRSGKDMYVGVGKASQMMLLQLTANKAPAFLSSEMDDVLSILRKHGRSLYAYGQSGRVEICGI